MTTPIVLLPGLHGTADLFEDFVRAAPSGYDPRPLEYPVDERLGFRELGERLATSLPDEPFLLLGESFGGGVALHLAERAAGLVLTATFASSPAPWIAKCIPWTASFWIRPRRIAGPHLLLQTCPATCWKAIEGFVAAKGLT